MAPGTTPPEQAVEALIVRWDGTEQAERANYIPFLNELCAVLGVPLPDPATGAGGDYRYERGVTHREVDGTTTTRRIDLYKRGCFVLEAKQGSNAPRQQTLFGTAESERRANVRRSPGWTQAMLKVRIPMMSAACSGAMSAHDSKIMSAPHSE